MVWCGVVCVCVSVCLCVCMKEVFQLASLKTFSLPQRARDIPQRALGSKMLPKRGREGRGQELRNEMKHK